MSGRIMSHVKAAWELMRAGKAEAGIDRLKRAHARDRSASNVMQLGEAFLWVKDYRAARRHFLTAIAKQAIVADCYFAMAGAASWCLRERETAVNHWHEGLRCGYTDAAGGITLPLLLFFASVVSAELFAETKAREELARRLRRHWARNWPGPLAEFVLGQTDLEAMEARYDRVTKADEFLSRWQTRFYVGVLKYARGDTPQYLELMRATAKTTNEDFDPKNDQYLGKLQHAEFFIARYESRRRTQKGKRSRG